MRTAGGDHKGGIADVEDLPIDFRHKTHHHRGCSQWLAQVPQEKAV